MADFIARHAGFRTMVRPSLLPIVDVSWLTTPNLGPVPALAFMLLLLALISATAVFYLEKYGCEACSVGTLATNPCVLRVIRHRVSEKDFGKPGGKNPLSKTIMGQAGVNSSS